VTNNTTAPFNVTVVLTLHFPNGLTQSQTRTATVNPGQPFTESQSYSIPNNPLLFPTGTYRLTAVAKITGGHSSATGKTRLE
jgi:hypothetical protein